MTSWTGARFISYLDLIACSFGGALLLFLLIAASSASTRGQPGDGLVLIRCHHLRGPRAELGLEFRRPGSLTWERAGASPNYPFFSVRSGPESGSEAVLLLPEPEPGVWSFRPYLVDFPRKDAGRNAIGVQFDVVGSRARRLPEEEPEALLWPGDTGPVLRVRVAVSE